MTRFSHFNVETDYKLMHRIISDTFYISSITPLLKLGLFEQSSILYKIEVKDNPSKNHNSLIGIRKLKE